MINQNFNREEKLKAETRRRTQVLMAAIFSVLLSFFLFNLVSAVSFGYTSEQPISSGATFGYNSDSVELQQSIVNNDYHNQTSFNITYQNFAYNQSQTLRWNVSGTNLFPESLGYNVGIGTTNPGAKLEVIGNVNLSSNLSVLGNDIRFFSENAPITPTINRTLTLSSNGSDSVGIQYRSLGTKNTRVSHYLDTNNNLFVYDYTFSNSGNIDYVWRRIGIDRFTMGTSPTNANFIVHLGYIGINTTTPRYALEINNITKALNVSNFLFANSTSVGIGTSTPSQRLHTYSASGNVWNLVESDGSNSNVGFISQNDAQAWSMGVSGSNSDSFAIDTGAGLGSPLFVIDTSGKVGIGTTLPREILEVYSTSAGQRGMVIQNNNSAGTTSLAKYELQNDAHAVAQFRIFGTNVTTSDLTIPNYAQLVSGSLASGLIVTTQGSANPLILGTNNIARVTINGTGSVGIGTSTPVSLLTMASDSTPAFSMNNTDITQASGQTMSSIRFYQSDSNGAGLTASINAIGVGTAGGQAIAFATGTTVGGRAERIRIDSNGFIGIGTDNPATELHGFTADANTNVWTMEVNGTAGDNIINFDFAGSTVASLQVDNSESDAFKINVGSNTAINIESDGKVGIGTTTPLYPLEININTSEANQSISLFTKGNISATGFITRTEVWDKSKNAITELKDANEYTLPNGKINHSAFGSAYVSWDSQRQIGVKQITNEVEQCEIIEEVEQCELVEEITEEPIYETYKEEGVSLGVMTAKHEQLIYEMAQELCAMGRTKWC